MEANTNEKSQFQNCFLNPNWETSMDQGTDPFESALSSIVSSPAASHAGPPDGDNIMIKELIGRLGVICNSGDMSPHSFFEAKSTNNSTNTSCYTTPLNSPPKLSLSSVMDHQIRSNFPVPATQFPQHQGLVPFSADPGFAERAARLSCFSSRNFSPLNGNFSLNPSELPPSRGSTDHPMKVATGGSHFSGNSTPGEMGDSREGSSLSEQIPAAAADFSANPRKRKSVQRGKQKDQPPSAKSSEVTEAEKEEPSAKKKAKTEEDGDGKKDEETGDVKKQSKDSNSKPQEPPKDYIHVRARRGQATDSHSLAERVRREKISQRMKVLQDLVPGCNKVTGKAIMLDEIINYVQSLQRQVEFLSMKLSTLNPRMDFNVEALVSKEMFQSRGSMPHSAVFPMEEESPTFPYGDAMSQFSLNLVSSRNHGMQMPPVEAAFSNAPLQVSGGLWEDDLQSLVQMGIPQNQSYGSSSSQMKVEL